LGMCIISLQPPLVPTAINIVANDNGGRNDKQWGRARFVRKN
jgi:hypothetical protein